MAVGVGTFLSTFAAFKSTLLTVIGGVEVPV
jgi:hypothetical protein